MKKKLSVLLIVIIIMYILSAGAFYILLNYINYETVCRIASEKHIEPAEILAIIQEESKFKKNAVSKKGAIGLMQVMPETFQEIGYDKIKNDDMFEVDINIRAGVTYLTILRDKFKDRDLAYIAYHSGPTKLKKWLIKNNKKEFNLEDFPIDISKKYVNNIHRNEVWWFKILNAVDICYPFLNVTKSPVNKL